MDKDYKKLLLDADIAKQEANTASELVHKVIERVSDGFVALDSNWIYTYVNERAARMLQRDSAAELIGKHIWTEYPEGVGQPFHQAYLKALESQQPVIFEEYFAPWDQWYENRIYPSPDGLTIYFSDITERKKAEQSINRANRALKLLGQCNEALIHATSEIGLLNEACRIISHIGDFPLVLIEYTEHTENNPRNLFVHSGFKEDHLDNLPASNQNVSEPVFIKDIFSERDDSWWQQTAKIYEVNSSVSLPIVIADTNYGVLTVFTNVTSDITKSEIKLLQELAGNIAYGIATMRAQAERGQLQRQLRQAQKMQAIGQLTGGIAHDFNNILGCMMGYTELSLERYAKDGGKLADYLNEVYQAGNRARDLIQQMLTFSRNTASNTSIISIAPLVKEALKLLQSTLTSSITIESNIDSDISNINIDPGHLHQLIMNLCINARDALDGEGLIEVTLSNVSKARSECDSCHMQLEGDYVALKVKDNGCGFEKVIASRIFDPFFTTKDVGQGTGMGLSIVHGLVHEHQGHILLESEPGLGATFTLLFPAVEADESRLQDKHKPYAVSALNQQRSGHILIIDDEEAVAILLAELLQLAGYQVTVVTNSAEALSLFEDNFQYFDMVITDQTMPNITGDELSRQMLQIKPDIPIILCTGHSEKIDSEKSEDIGIARFLQKPVSHKVLLANIDKILVMDLQSHTMRKN